MDEKRIRYCKKCLLQDFANQDYLEHMKVYLDGIPEDSKTEEKLYQERLAYCVECNNLNEGICKICGCFVEYRAAVKYKRCPAIHPKW